MTIEGASNGITEYIRIWDMIVLRTEGEVRGVAVSQISFLVRPAFGILTAFGSHCPRYEPAVINATIIS